MLFTHIYQQNDKNDQCVWVSEWVTGIFSILNNILFWTSSLWMVQFVMFQVYLVQIKILFCPLTYVCLRTFVIFFIMHALHDIPFYLVSIRYCIHFIRKLLLFFLFYLELIEQHQWLLDVIIHILIKKCVVLEI